MTTPVSFIGASSGGATPNPLVLATPAGVTPGSFMLAALSSTTVVDSTPGWTDLGVEGPWSSRFVVVRWRFAVAGEPATQTFTDTSGARIWGGIAAIDGVDPDVPSPTSVGRTRTSAATTLPIPASGSIISPRDGSILVGTVGTTLGAASVTPPGSMTELWDVASGTPNRVSNEFAIEDLPTAGIVGTRTFTFASSTCGGILVVLQPSLLVPGWRVGAVSIG